MRGGRRLRVPELAQKQGLRAIDLVRRPEFLFAPSTATRLMNGDIEWRALSFEFLEKLSRGLGVPVEKLWVWEE